jgi:4-amino-4-deoxy-L-arabinose transferase-like glycosyltransferase
MKFKSPETLSLAVLLLIVICWLLPFWMIGMFDDGVFYACISRNLATEPGSSIWDLKVGNFIDPAFNGHPPMAFWMQAIFFRLIGDYFWVERFYSLLMGFLSLFLIVKIWQFFSDRYSNLPIFFWLLIPAVGWAYMNNILENTLTVFALAAVWALIAYEKGKIGKWFALLTATIMIFAALLTKGPTALFPLVLPIIYAIVFNKNRIAKGFLHTAIMTVLLMALLFFLFYFDKRALLFFQVYAKLQLWGSLTESTASGGRFQLFLTLFQEMILSLVVLLIGYVLFVKKVVLESGNKKAALFFLLIAFSASLPLMISPKQGGFYLVPSYPFFALFFGILVSQYYFCLKERLKPFKKLGYTINLILITACFVFFIISLTNFGKYSRNKDLLADVFQIGKIVPEHSEIYLSPELYSNWKLHAYMYRYFYIDLPTVYKKQEFAIFSKKAPLNLPDDNYRLIDLKFNELSLFKKIDSN